MSNTGFRRVRVDIEFKKPLIKISTSAQLPNNIKNARSVEYDLTKCSIAFTGHWSFVWSILRLTTVRKGNPPIGSLLPTVAQLLRFNLQFEISNARSTGPSGTWTEIRNKRRSSRILIRDHSADKDPNQEMDRSKGSSRAGCHCQFILARDYLINNWLQKLE